MREGETMAAPRVRQVKSDVVGEEPVVAAAVPKKPSMLDQEHTVYVGDRIQLNGTIFHVMSGVYAWHMVGPDGKDCSLTCDTMPSPYFTPDAVGVYDVTLPTDDGMAEITIKVSEAP